MEPVFLGEISMFAGNFAPRGWALCDGQLLAISQNTALFSILGTTYGGDGRTTFGLPRLRGRTPMHPGNGPGLSRRRLGESLGTEFNVLHQLNLPSHNHIAITNVDVKVAVNSASGEDSEPNDQYIAGGNNIYIDAAGTNQYLGGVSAAATTTLGLSGNNQSINNIQPSLVMNYIIALSGLYPSRN